MTDGDSDRRASPRAFVLIGAILVAAATLTFLISRGNPVPSDMDGRVRAVAATLRCLVCQDLSVADSPSPLASEMRQTIAEQLRAGRTPDQIRAFFVARYGQVAILLLPPKHGLTLIPWLLPFVLLFGGVAALVIATVRWTRSAHDAEGPTPGDVADAPDPLSAGDRRLLERARASFAEDEP